MQTFKNEPGIFIRDSIRTAAGRRTAYLIEYIISKIQESNETQKLVNGFTFITYNEIWDKLNYFKNTVKQALHYFDQTGATETVYLEEGLLIKIDEVMFEETLILRQKSYLILQEDFKNQHQDLPVPSATQPTEKTKRKKELEDIKLRKKQLVECSKTRKDLSVLCKECRAKFHDSLPSRNNSLTPSPYKNILRRRKSN